MFPPISIFKLFHTKHPREVVTFVGDIVRTFVDGIFAHLSAILFAPLSTVYSPHLSAILFAPLSTVYSHICRRYCLHLCRRYIFAHLSAILFAPLSTVIVFKFDLIKFDFNVYNYIRVYNVGILRFEDLNINIIAQLVMLPASVLD